VTDVLVQRAIASGCLVGTYRRHDTSIKVAEAAAQVVGASPMPSD
jgi:hypothetical protein